MRLTRWTPARSGRDLMTVQDELNRLFEDVFARSPFANDLAPLFAPPADIHETPEDFVVKMDLPGMTLKDVKVSLAGDTLTIRGERKEEKVENETHRHRVERVLGAFERTFELGAPLSSDRVKATYHDGVLEVRVPKAETAKVREIEIQSR